MDENEAYVVTLSAGGQVAIPKFMRGQARPGERFLIVKVGDGYFLKPVRSLDLRTRLEEVQSQLSAVAKRAGIRAKDVDRMVDEVRHVRRLPRGA